MVIAETSLGRDPADQLSAIASGLFSIARAAARLGGTDVVRQVVVEADDMLLFAMAAGTTAVLAAVANPGTDAGLLGTELARTARAAAPLLGCARLGPG